MLENEIQVDDPELVETFGPLEADPTGRGQHEVGAKLDHGKSRVGLVVNGFARALSAVSQVGTYGATKYTPNGWTEVPMAYHGTRTRCTATYSQRRRERRWIAIRD